MGGNRLGIGGGWLSPETLSSSLNSSRIRKMNFDFVDGYSELLLTLRYLQREISTSEVQNIESILKLATSTEEPKWRSDCLAD